MHYIGSSSAFRSIFFFTNPHWRIWKDMVLFCKCCKRNFWGYTSSDNICNQFALKSPSHKHISRFLGKSKKLRILLIHRRSSKHLIILSTLHVRSESSRRLVETKIESRLIQNCQYLRFVSSKYVLLWVFSLNFKPSLSFKHSLHLIST